MELQGRQAETKDLTPLQKLILFLRIAWEYLQSLSTAIRAQNPQQAGFNWEAAFNVFLDVDESEPGSN